MEHLGTQRYTLAQEIYKALLRSSAVYKNRGCDYPHFTDRRVEDQRCKITWQRP